MISEALIAEHKFKFVYFWLLNIFRETKDVWVY